MVKVIHHLKQKLYARQESLFWNGGDCPKTNKLMNKTNR